MFVPARFSLSKARVLRNSKFSGFLHVTDFGHYLLCHVTVCVTKDINNFLVKNKKILHHNSSSLVIVLYVIT